MQLFGMSPGGAFWCLEDGRGHGWTECGLLMWQTSWGHGNRECKTLRCTDTLVSAEEASHATGSCDARLSSLYEGYGFRRMCPCV